MNKKLIHSNTSLLAKSMSASISQLKQAKKSITQLADTVFLLDTSGSMNRSYQGKRLIDHLKSAIADYPNLRKFSFNSGFYPDTIPNPDGGTDMAYAFGQIFHFYPQHIILVSDGLPNDQTAAIEAAKRTKAKVDIIYIGKPGDPGEAFMLRLARLCGGQTFTASLLKNVENQISNTVQKLIGMG